MAHTPLEKNKAEEEDQSHTHIHTRKCHQTKEEDEKKRDEK